MTFHPIKFKRAGTEGQSDSAKLQKNESAKKNGKRGVPSAGWGCVPDFIGLVRFGEFKKFSLSKMANLVLSFLALWPDPI